MIKKRWDLDRSHLFLFGKIVLQNEKGVVNMFWTDQYGNRYPYPVDAIGRPVNPSGNVMMPTVQTTAQTPSSNVRSGYICSPVTSREEAVATRVEAFGPPVIMPDLGHGMIYYKRFNEQTALADFEAFQKVPQETPTEAPKQQAPSIDYSAVIATLAGQLSDISGKINEIYERLEPKAPPQKTKGAGEK